MVNVGKYSIHGSYGNDIYQTHEFFCAGHKSSDMNSFFQRILGWLFEIKYQSLSYTLPETNIAHENPVFPGKKWWIFHGYVSFQECRYLGYVSVAKCC